MLIFAMQGLGKSTLAKSAYPRYRHVDLPIEDYKYEDLESRKIRNGWMKLYVNDVKTLIRNGFTVSVGIRSTLHLIPWSIVFNDCDHLLVMPHPKLKDTYMKRYTKRGDNDKFKVSIESNWNLVTTFGLVLSKVPIVNYLLGMAIVTNPDDYLYNVIYENDRKVVVEDDYC